MSFELPEERRKILLGAKNLRNSSDFGMIYIAPDLTKSQQEEDRKLREKLKEFRQQGIQNVRIVKGQIVKEENGARKVLFPVADTN